MNRTQQAEVADLLRLISGSFPLTQNADPASVATAYMMAIEGYEYEDVVPVLKNIITGRQVGFQGRWAPTSAEIGDWILTRSTARNSRAAGHDGAGLVPYAIGAKPPPGYIAVGEFNERRDQLAIEARKGAKIIPLPKMRVELKNDEP